MQMRRLILIGALMAALGTEAAVFDVYVYDDEYSINPPPGAVADPVINAGDTVQWIWDSSIIRPHNVQSVSGSAETFNSGAAVIDRAPFEHTFTLPGLYDYFCIVHGGENNGITFGMAGTVTVVPEPEVWGGVTALSLLGAIIVRRGLRKRAVA